MLFFSSNFLRQSKVCNKKRWRLFAIFSEVESIVSTEYIDQSFKIFCFNIEMKAISDTPRK